MSDVKIEKSSGDVFKDRGISNPMTAGREDLAGLKERLIAPIHITVRNGGQWVTISSPFKDLVREEAHAAIIKLEQENAKLRGEREIPIEELTDAEIGKMADGMGWNSDTIRTMYPALLNEINEIRETRRAAEALRADVEG